MLEITFKDKLTQQQLDELILYIEASEAYYTDEPIMSDPEFDLLSDKLKSYGISELTEFISKRIFRDKIGMEEVIPETQEMISLEKIKWVDRSSVPEINKFFRLTKPVQTTRYKYAAKFDGAALKINWFFDSLNFDTPKPYLKSIITRGGIDVTEHFKDHPNIIETAKYGFPIITGELLCPKKVFNEKYSIESGGDYENARNFVGKLFKQLKIEKSIIDDLVFVPLTNGKNALNNEHWKDIPENIGTNFFYTLPDIITHFKSDNFPFLCDGIVLAYDEFGERKVKDNYPLNMVAIKFPGSQAKTKVIDMYYTQKKSGKLTPMCMIEPVPLDGATMTKANGYNYQNMIDKHIGIGSEVIIEKSGDIIPVIIKCLSYSNNIKMPDVEYKRCGKHLIAIDLEESRKYKFVLALKSLQIDGIGDVNADQIGAVVGYNIFDLFNPIWKPQICEKLGGGDRWIKFQEFYNIKSITLDKLIYLHQFNQVGDVISRKIALLITKKSNDISNIPGDILNTVCKGEGFQKIKDSIEFLKIHKIQVIAPLEINNETITFEMTGNPSGMTKDEFKKRLKILFPDSVHESLKKDTKYLFTDSLSKNGGKINKARKYNIKIVLYSDALNGKI